MHLNDVLNEATVLPWVPNSDLLLVWGCNKWRNTTSNGTYLF